MSQIAEFHGATEIGAVNINKVEAGWSVSVTDFANNGRLRSHYFLLDDDKNVLSSSAELPARYEDGPPGTVSQQEFVSPVHSIESVLAAVDAAKN